MTTANDIVTAALRKLGIASASQPVSATDLNDGLAQLNLMLHSWKLRSVDIGHADYAAGDTFALGPEFVEGTIYNLAMRIGTDYEVPQSFNADAWFRSIQAAYCDPQPLPLDSALTDMPSGRRRFYL